MVHNDISFSVNEGEIFGVLGGSGSGKECFGKTNSYAKSDTKR